jgi:hypothetical protein
MFIVNESEINNLSQKKTASLIVLRGRRRIGKYYEGVYDLFMSIPRPLRANYMTSLLKKSQTQFFKFLIIFRSDEKFSCHRIKFTKFT